MKAAENGGLRSAHGMCRLGDWTRGTDTRAANLGRDTASGTFVISAGLFISGMATLGGTLDCSTGNFTGALTNGTYNVFFGLLTGTFDGPLTSEYNGNTLSFVNGAWSLTVPGEGYCQGQGSANYAGPAEGGAPGH